MATLDWITAKGFKSIASIEKQSLGPINILIRRQRIGEIKLH